MHRTSIRRILLLAACTLLLTALGLPATATYHGEPQGDDPGDGTEGAPDYATRWQDVKADLASGNVTDAWATYNATFAPHADAHPAARDAVEEAFAAAVASEGPDDLDYVAAQQAIDKAHYAIAYANIHRAAGTGDVEAASAWFDLLAAKFAGASDLPESKAAFADVTAGNLNATVATLDGEYRDLITMKVHDETMETPELLEAGDQRAAVKEAAEARYYHLSIQDHVEEVLGTEDGAGLRSELNEIIELAKVGDLGTTREEADEALGFIARYALLTASSEEADAFATYKGHIGDEDLDAARAVYEEEFAEEAEEYAPDAHARIQQAFTDAEVALDAGDAAEYTVQAQLLKKGVLHVAHVVAFHELEEGEVDEGVKWFRILSAKFGWDDAPGEAGTNVGLIAAANAVDEARLDAARQATVDKFLSKVREETVEVFLHWDDPPTAREKAIEGVAYYAPAKDHVATVLSDAVADELESEIQALYDATTAGDRAAAEEARDEIIALLDQVAAEGEDVSELDALVNDLRGKIEFVATEVRGYYEAKEVGNTQEATMEIGEARAFLSAAQRKVTANRDTLAAADADAVARIEANLEELNATLHDDEGLADPATEAAVDAKVAATVDLLVSLKGSAAPGTVTVVLGPAGAGDDPGTLVVPVRLTGLPDVSFGYQIALGFDPELLEAVSVEDALDVGASSLEEGVVRFNGATAEAQGTDVLVAEVTFRVLDPDAGTVPVDVTVEDLTTGDGEALGVKEVTGAEVDVSAVSTADAPGPGILLAFAAAALGAVVGGRRRLGNP